MATLTTPPYLQRLNIRNQDGDLCGNIYNSLNDLYIQAHTGRMYLEAEVYIQGHGATQDIINTCIEDSGTNATAADNVVLATLRAETVTAVAAVHASVTAEIDCDVAALKVILDADIDNARVEAVDTANLYTDGQIAAANSAAAAVVAALEARVLLLEQLIQDMIYST